MQIKTKVLLRLLDIQDGGFDPLEICDLGRISGAGKPVGISIGNGDCQRRGERGRENTDVGT
jgi:hypothetical protein